MEVWEKRSQNYTSYTNILLFKKKKLASLDGEKYDNAETLRSIKCVSL